MGLELQYLREGFLRHLEKIVVLKSGGWCKFLRSSSTDAHSVMGHNDKIMGRNKYQVEEIVTMIMIHE